MTFVLIFLGVLFGLMALGVPVGIVLLLCGMAIMAALGVNDPRTVGQYMLNGLNLYILMALPFFILSGELMGKGGLMRRIVDVSRLFVGRFRGGLGYTAVVTALIFSGLTGSALAESAALGTMLIPLMSEAGYNKARSGGFIASTTVLAPLIPPSNAFIVIGVACNLSISRLMLGGIAPGFVFAFALMIGWFIIAKRDGYNDQRKYTHEEAKIIVKDAIPALVMPVLVVGGIRFGWFTPTEAGAFCVVYALLVCNFYYKELNWKKTKEALLEAALSTGAIALVIAGAKILGYYLTMARLHVLMVELMGGLVDRPLMFLLAINLFLLLIGLVMDMVPSILIFGPILLPMVAAAGIDPYLFALIMCVNLNLGLITPPVGMVLFIMQRITRENFMTLVIKSLPFLVITLVVLLLYVFFPQLYLVPLRLIFGK